MDNIKQKVPDYFEKVISYKSRLKLLDKIELKQVKAWTLELPDKKPHLFKDVKTFLLADEADFDFENGCPALQCCIETVDTNGEVSIQADFGSVSYNDECEKCRKLVFEEGSMLWVSQLENYNKAIKELLKIDKKILSLNETI